MSLSDRPLVAAALIHGAEAEVTLEGALQLAELLYGRRPHWWDLALCRSREAEGVDFFASPKQTGPAREVCARCDARYPCREDALRDGMRKGIWGGTDEVERALIRAERKSREVA